MNNRAISPVIGASFLLVVSIFAVIGFQNWFQTYQGNLFVQVDQNSQSEKIGTDIEAVIGYNLYFKNGFTNISISEIKINNISCPIGISYNSGMQPINITSCLELLSGQTGEIVIITDKGIFSKTLSLENANLGKSCFLDSITKEEGESYTFYNSTIVPYGSSCSGVSRTCNVGNFSGDNSYQYSSCLVDVQDTMPNSFNFINQIDAELGDIIISETLVPNGFNGVLSVLISGQGTPLISVNNGSWVTNDSMNFGDNLTIRLISAISYETENIATLTLGDYSTNWSVTTKALSSSLICDTDSDGDGFISYLCANYPMSITTLEGHLDPNDSNSTIVPAVNCVWSDDKSGCIDNFIVDGCGSGTVLDIGTSLCWQRNFNAVTRNWDQAISYCDLLSLGGHTDWYLPSRQELNTVVDLSRPTAPFVVGGNNNKFQNVQSYWYWTKSIAQESISNAYSINFEFGYTSGGGDKSYVSNLACVRRN